MAVQNFTHLVLVYFNKNSHCWCLTHMAFISHSYLTWNNRMFGPGYFMSVFHRLTTLNTREGCFVQLDLQLLARSDIFLYS